MNVRRAWKGQTFVDDALDVCNLDAEDCVFDGCILYLRRESATHFVKCDFKDCRYEGDGWPPQILAHQPS